MRRGIGPVVLLLLAAALAGCTGADAPPEPSPSPSATPPPAPKSVFNKDGEIAFCPPTPPATGTAIVKTFKVPDGYDELFVQFHTSGEGRVSASIIQKNGSKVIWEVRDQTIHTAPTTCGGHAHGTDGTKFSIAPGEFEVRITPTGAIAMHLEATARSSKATNQTAPHDH